MILYHYCTLESFSKILESKEIWLTEMRRMNDHLEGVWIDKVVERAIGTHFPKLSPGFMEPILSACRRMSKTYGLCMSENGDLLSQWRAYADDGRGVSIGIDKSFFEWVINQKSGAGFRIQKVIYDKGEQDQQLRSTETFKEIQGTLELEEKEYNEDKSNNSESILDERVREIHNLAIRGWRNELYRYKNPAFSEEVEQRFLASVPNFSKIDGPKMGHAIRHLMSVKTRIQKDHLTSYVALPLAPTDKKDLPYIKNVVLGPKNTTDIKDMDYYLNLNGIQNCTVTASEASYR